MDILKNPKFMFSNEADKFTNSIKKGINNFNERNTKITNQFEYSWNILK